VCVSFYHALSAQVILFVVVHLRSSLIVTFGFLTQRFCYLAGFHAGDNREAVLLFLRGRRISGRAQAGRSTTEPYDGPKEHVVDDDGEYDQYGSDDGGWCHHQYGVCWVRYYPGAVPANDSV
jgi:hypothetical protein